MKRASEPGHFRIDLFGRRHVPARQDYPREWGEFERWLNRPASDVCRAQYGKSKVKWVRPFDDYWPTAGASISGRICILLGTLAGFVIGLAVFISQLSLGGAKTSINHPPQAINEPLDDTTQA